MTTKTLLLFILLALFLSCNRKSQPKESSRSEKKEVINLGAFVYIDRASVLHTRTGCKAVFKDHSMQVVHPSQIEDVVRGDLDRICSQCVTEDQLSILMGYVAAKEKSYSDSIVSQTIIDYDTEITNADY